MITGLISGLIVSCHCFTLHDYSVPRIVPLRQRVGDERKKKDRLCPADVRTVSKTNDKISLIGEQS